MAFNRILVVNDEPLMQDFLVEVLIRKQYVCDTAEDGWQAIEKVKNDNFDLVITDYRHPGPKGFEILEFTKKHSRMTEVIILSAFALVKDYYTEGIKLGAFDCIQKPVSMDKLAITVDRALEYKRLKEENSALHNDNNLQGGIIGMTLREVEKRIILCTLEAVNGNRTRAAKILGISVRTLRNKLNKYFRTM